MVASRNVAKPLVRLPFVLVAFGLLLLSGCTTPFGGEDNAAEGQGIVPYRSTLDIVPSGTQWLTFDEPRGGDLVFDYELVSAGQAWVCLMTTPSRELYEQGEEVPCGHEATLGGRAPTRATFENDFDGGEYHVAIECEGNDPCAVHARIRHDDAEYVPSDQPMASPNRPLAFGTKRTEDLDPERGVLYAFQVPSTGRVTYSVANLRDASLTTCIVEPAESTRLLAGKPAYCLASGALAKRTTWSGFRDLAPGDYGLYVRCTTQDLAGCSYSVKIDLDDGQLAIESMEFGTTSPSGMAATALPHRHLYQIEAQRAETIVFGVPDGQRLKYSLETGRWPYSEAFTANFCIADEADVGRLQGHLPVACEKEAGVWTDGYSPHKWDHGYVDLPQGWHAARLHCTSTKPCTVELKLWLEDDVYADLRAAKSGLSPNGHPVVASAGQQTVDQEPATRRAFVFQLTEEGRLEFGAEQISGSYADFALIYEDQVADFLAGKPVHELGYWFIDMGGFWPDKSFSDFRDLEADWYALVVQTGSSDELSYRINWEAAA